MGSCSLWSTVFFSVYLLFSWSGGKKMVACHHCSALHLCDNAIDLFMYSDFLLIGSVISFFLFSFFFSCFDVYWKTVLVKEKLLINFFGDYDNRNFFCFNWSPYIIVFIRQLCYAWMMGIPWPCQRCIELSLLFDRFQKPKQILKTHGLY